MTHLFFQRTKSQKSAEVNEREGEWELRSSQALV